MKKVNALVLGLAVLLAFGCDGGEKKEDPTPVNQVQKDCLITKEIYNEDTAEYTYNSAGQFVSVYSTLNSVKKYRLNEILYNADGNIFEKRSFQPNSNSHDQKFVFSYNADKLPASITYSMLQNNVWKDMSFTYFKYNAAKQLIKKSYYTSYDTAAIFYALYSYLAPNHIIQTCYQKDNTDNYPLTYTYDLYYDNKQFYRLSLGYYALTHSTFEEGLVSKHNLATVTTTDHLHGTTSTYNYGYTYNNHDYPVEYLDPSSGTYAKYEYNCQ